MATVDLFRICHIATLAAGRKQHLIYKYALHIIKGRWPEGEKVLLESKDPFWIKEYTQDVINKYR